MMDVYVVFSNLGHEVGVYVHSSLELAKAHAISAGFPDQVTVEWEQIDDHTWVEHCTSHDPLFYHMGSTFDIWVRKYAIDKDGTKDG